MDSDINELVRHIGHFNLIILPILLVLLFRHAWKRRCQNEVRYGKRKGEKCGCLFTVRIIQQYGFTPERKRLFYVDEYCLRCTSHPHHAGVLYWVTFFMPAFFSFFGVQPLVGKTDNVKKYEKPALPKKWYLRMLHS